MPDDHDRPREEASENSSPHTEIRRSQDAEFFQLIKAADTLDKLSLLGFYGRFLAPFSYQFKTQIRSFFPDDKRTFDETDRNEKLAIQQALRMRLITFVAFIAFSASVFLSLKGSDISYLHWNGVDQHWSAFFVFVAIAAITLGIRSIVRHEYLGDIRNDATKFASFFLIQLNNILDRAINAVRSSTDDLMLTSDWPDRSAGWIKIALFFDKRFENVDRYVTATAWRVESRYRIIERIFVAAKFLVFASVLVAAGLLYPGSEAPLVGPYFATLLVYATIALTRWGMRVQKNNAYWSDRFRESVVGFDEQKENIYVQIAKVIAADKRYFMSGQRGSGKSKDH